MFDIISLLETPQYFPTIYRIKLKPHNYSGFHGTYTLLTLNFSIFPSYAPRCAKFVPLLMLSLLVPQKDISSMRTGTTSITTISSEPSIMWHTVGTQWILIEWTKMPHSQSYGLFTFQLQCHPLQKVYTDISFLPQYPPYLSKSDLVLLHFGFGLHSYD